MNLQRYLKQGKNIIIEIDDVEYVLDDEMVAALERGDELISVKRLYDGATVPISSILIEKAISQDGAVDYLDK